MNDKLHKKIVKFLYKNHLCRIRTCSSVEELKRFLLDVEPQVARNYAYKLLAARAYLSVELEKKLSWVGISSEVIAQVIVKCRQLGYLSDKKQVECMIKSGIERGWGQARIERKLIQKGVSKNDIRGIEVMVSQEQQREALTHWINKKWPDYAQCDRLMKGKIFRFLQRKGFDEELIREFLFDD